jgi:hypothetical protein
MTATSIFLKKYYSIVMVVDNKKMSKKVDEQKTRTNRFYLEANENRNAIQ